MFTKHLLQDLTKADLEIHKMLRDVARAVCEASKGKQLPVCDPNLINVFFVFVFFFLHFLSNYAKP